jgi:hypothetical protein
VRKNRFPQIHINGLQGLPLSLINRYRKAKLHGELLTPKNPRRVAFIAREDNSGDSTLFPIKPTAQHSGPKDVAVQLSDYQPRSIVEAFFRKEIAK